LFEGPVALAKEGVLHNIKFAKMILDSAAQGVNWAEG
jgi:hypothetical protein